MGCRDYIKKTENTKGTNTITTTTTGPISSSECNQSRNNNNCFHINDDILIINYSSYKKIGSLGVVNVEKLLRILGQATHRKSIIDFLPRNVNGITLGKAAIQA